MMMTLRTDEEAMQRLTLDEYGRWMLDHGHYDVDVETGVVTNLRRGRGLKGSPGNTGYPVVYLAYSRDVQRPVRTHRLVAIKVWGIEAIRGKEIGHRDGVRTHSYLSNLVLFHTHREHYRFDAAQGPDRIHGSVTRMTEARRKKSWPPCVVCGDPDGRRDVPTGSPVRISGERFGVNGTLCRRCHKRLAQRQARESSGAAIRLRARRDTMATNAIATQR